MNRSASYVTINNIKSYRLGQFFPRQEQIQCIAMDGLVHRVAHFQNGYLSGVALFTSGERLHYHHDKALFDKTAV